MFTLTTHKYFVEYKMKRTVSSTIHTIKIIDIHTPPPDASLRNADILQETRIECE